MSDGFGVVLVGEDGPANPWRELAATTAAGRREAFSTLASGIVVPAALARERKVFTRDESRLVERAVKVLNAGGLEVYFGCSRPECKGRPLEPRRRAGGEFVLECDHADHVFTRQF